MSRENGLISAAVCNSTALPRAGMNASILYLQGRAKCDQYGRLPGAPDQLLLEVLKNWAFELGWAEQVARDARDALVRERLWILYTVQGVEYVEYVGYDADQQEGYLRNRRAAAPTYPDPPNRPDLWACNRLHRPSKGETTGPQNPKPPTDQPPHGSADLPAEQPAQAAVPSAAEQPQGAVPAAPSGAARGQDEAQQPAPVTVYPDGFAQLAACHEHHAANLLNQDDRQQLLNVLKDAEAAGVPWQTLLTIMKDKQREYKPSHSQPRIKRISYYVPTWDQHIRTAPSDIRRPIRGSQTDDAPPDEIDDPIARRAREQSERLRSGANAAATA